MKLADFKIGTKFSTANRNLHYLCTDVGSRSVVAVEIDETLEAKWYEGPPFYLPQIVFEEHELADLRRYRAPVGYRRTEARRADVEEAA